MGYDEKEGKEFLKCEYNMFGDSFRSPWSNAYFPPVETQPGEEEDIIYPSPDFLSMETQANEIFLRYAKLYYDEHFHTSVYFFDTDDSGFGSCWLIKKSKSKINQILNIEILALPFPGSDENSVWDS